tara:strand:+ start:19 stop:387 length:369 start_codon:yes stop_codon:yes gene_type:complete
MTKNLTEKQQKFLAALFDEANGDARLAKKMAGYSSETRLSEVVKPLKDEIMEATKEYMAYVAPKAAMAMGNALVDPTELGIRDKMTAAKDLLDRAGLIKTEKVNVESSGGLFVLPAKEGKNE